jgi:RNA-directed DNA polymerase
MRRVYGRKVTRITLGGLPVCLVLPTSRGVGTGRQKSAEAIVVGLTARQRAKHEASDRRLEFR